MFKTIFKQLFIGILIVLVFSSVALAATITVCQDGSCDYTDFSEAVYDADQGDTVLITDGLVYEEDHGTEVRDRDVTINCQGATIQGTGDTSGSRSAGIDLNGALSAQNTTIKNCKIQNYLYPISQRANSLGVTISGNEFRNFSVAMALSAGDAVVENNYIEFSTSEKYHSAIGVYAYGDNGFTITGNQITGIPATAGLHFVAVENAIVHSNQIEGCTYAIKFYGSSNNIVYENDFNSMYVFFMLEWDPTKKPHGEGKKLLDDIKFKHLKGHPKPGQIIKTNNGDVLNNNVYHNNIDVMLLEIHNTGNVTPAALILDEGYPSGGNYWDIYTTPDNFKGPDQNIIGSDGIVDFEYNISIYTDNYPLTDPYTSPLNVPPVANFTFTNSTPATFDFTDLSFDIDGNVVAWDWDFGDTGTSTVQNPQHIYAASGLYNVTLEITDNGGATDTMVQQVTVTIPVIINNPPTANFTFNCTSLTCVFTDTSTDADGTVVAWLWDFEGVNSTLQNPQYNFVFDGTYNVTLTVTDDDGAIDSISKNVTVSDSTIPNIFPVANFTFNCTDLVCDFTDTSTDVDGNVVAWAWDFNDTTNSALQNPQHTFPVNGTYNVTLVVTDNDGENDTITQPVTVAVGVTTNQPPIANAGSNRIAYAGYVTAFNGDNSFDPDGTIVLYEWDFDGDGIYDWNSTTTGATTFTYVSVGSYNSILRVTDNNGATDVDNAIISVTWYYGGGGGAGGGSSVIEEPPEDDGTDDLIEEPPEDDGTDDQDNKEDRVPPVLTPNPKYNWPGNTDTDTEDPAGEETYGAGFTGMITGAFANPIVSAAFVGVIIILSGLFILWKKGTIAALSK